MTKSTMKKLEVLRNATARYSPRVKQRLSKAGRSADAAVVQSAAKYYVALKKLAEK
jgi:hypothetical protein